MGRNNQNAGMHFVHHKYQSFSLYDYDSLLDYSPKAISRVGNTNDLKNIALEEKRRNVNIEYKNRENWDREYYCENVIANILIKALEKKLDIWDIIHNCTNDWLQLEMLPDFESKQYSRPLIFPVMTFLSELASRMECNISDFFSNNHDQKKTFVYDFLDQIDDFDENEFGESNWDSFQNIEAINSNRFSMFIEDFDYKYGMAKEPWFNIEEPKDILYLTIGKHEIFGTFYYYLSFGTHYSIVDWNSINKKYQPVFLAPSAVLWEEADGKLADYVKAKIQIMKNVLYDYSETPNAIFIKGTSDSINNCLDHMSYKDIKTNVKICITYLKSKSEKISDVQKNIESIRNVISFFGIRQELIKIWVEDFK